MNTSKWKVLFGFLTQLLICCDSSNLDSGSDISSSEAQASSSSLSYAESYPQAFYDLLYGRMVVMTSPWCAAAGHCGEFTDLRDDQVYAWTKIGKQTWMSQNLNYSGTGKGWCWGVGGLDTTQHQDHPSCQKLGRFYNWAEAVGLDNSYLVQNIASAGTDFHRDICPTGWHLPSLKEWKILLDTVNRELPLDKRDHQAAYLRAVISPNREDWDSTRTNAGDPYGFSIVPTGYRRFDYDWSGLNVGVFWTADEYAGNMAVYMITSDWSWDLSWSHTFKNEGCNIRCLNDSGS